MSHREAANRHEMGGKRYAQRIHKESKFADDNKNLPYKFSKPKKEKAHNTYYECEKCNKGFAVTEDTVVVICGGCKHLNRVKELKKKES